MLIHPKMKILSFAQPHDFLNLYEFLLLNTKEDILKNDGNQVVIIVIIHVQEWISLDEMVFICYLTLQAHTDLLELLFWHFRLQEVLICILAKYLVSPETFQHLYLTFRF